MCMTSHMYFLYIYIYMYIYIYTYTCAHIRIYICVFSTCMLCYDCRICAYCFEVFLYYWDDRDGQDFTGWWFGDSVGGSAVCCLLAELFSQPAHSIQ